jgi:uncharacterized membrane protein YdfJ with MMPL/SSD domain
MRKILLVLSISVVGIFFYMTQDSKPNKGALVDEKKELDKKIELKSFKRSDIHVVFKDEESLQSSKHKTTKKAKEFREDKKENFSQRSSSENNYIDDTSPVDEDLKKIVEDGYVSTSQKIGDYTVEVVTQQRVEKNDELPPSIPLVVNGKVDGKTFSISVQREEVRDGFYAVVKDKNNKVVKIKELSPEIVQQSAIIDLESKQQEGNAVEQAEQTQEKQEEIQKQNFKAPPVPPSF